MEIETNLETNLETNQATNQVTNYVISQMLESSSQAFIDLLFQDQHNIKRLNNPPFTIDYEIDVDTPDGDENPFNTSDLASSIHYFTIRNSLEDNIVNLDVGILFDAFNIATNLSEVAEHILLEAGIPNWSATLSVDDTNYTVCVSSRIYIENI